MDEIAEEFKVSIQCVSYGMNLADMKGREGETPEFFPSVKGMRQIYVISLDSGLQDHVT